jgi:hypothetical protein
MWGKESELFLYFLIILLDLKLGIELTGHILLRSLIVLLRIPFSALGAPGMQVPTSMALLLLMEPILHQGKLLHSTSTIVY